MGRARRSGSSQPTIRFTLAMENPQSGIRDPRRLIRPLLRRLRPYVPGEQPKIKGLIKLNTNENPYPPSPRVLSAIRAAVDGRLRLYPSPTAQGLRERLAELHSCKPENIIVGNGSDRSEEHTSELQSLRHLVCRLLL